MLPSQHHSPRKARAKSVELKSDYCVEQKGAVPAGQGQEEMP
jgi:hypothetical protein